MAVFLSAGDTLGVENVTYCLTSMVDQLGRRDFVLAESNNDLVQLLRVTASGILASLLEDFLERVTAEADFWAVPLFMETQPFMHPDK